MSWFDYNYIIEKETLTAIADAIREKRGEPFFTFDPVEMPQKIRGIQGEPIASDGIELYVAASMTAVTSSLSSLGANAFSVCKNLERVELPNATSIAEYGFKNCYSLKSVVLPSETVCYLAMENAFYNCYHFSGIKDNTYNPTGAKDGKILVPSNLVNSYKTSTNWSAFADLISAIDEGGGEMGGGDAEGNWLFQNEHIDSNGRDVLDENGMPIVPADGVSYTLFVDGEEIGTSTCASYGDGIDLSFNTEDYRVYFRYTTGIGWHFHPIDSQVTSGSVSIRINE